MANAITQISHRAKQLTKANKKLAWKDAIKKASAEYRAGKKVSGAKKVAGVKKVAGAKKAGSVKSRAKNIVHSVKSHVKLHNENKAARLKEKCKSIGAVKSDGMAILSKKLGSLEVKKVGARLKSERNKIGKEMATVRGQMRKLSSL